MIIYCEKFCNPFGCPIDKATEENHVERGLASWLPQVDSDKTADSTTRLPSEPPQPQFLSRPARKELNVA